MVNILFVCKYNRFRSKFSEEYFNEINKNKSIKAESAGIIEVNAPLNSEEKQRNKYIFEKFGIKMDPVSRGVNVRVLEKQDKIIIVAKDVPRKVFDNPLWKEKVVFWRISDVYGNNKKKINKSLNLLKKRIQRLVKRLEKQK